MDLVELRDKKLRTIKTPRGTLFSNSKVHSIYKKGQIREERINRKDIVEVSQVTIEELK